MLEKKGQQLKGYRIPMAATTICLRVVNKLFLVGAFAAILGTLSPATAAASLGGMALDSILEIEVDIPTTSNNVSGPNLVAVLSFPYIPGWSPYGEAVTVELRFRGSRTTSNKHESFVFAATDFDVADGDMPFVNHTDQWDIPNLHFKESGVPIAIKDIRSVRMTKYIAMEPSPTGGLSSAWSYIDMIMPCNYELAPATPAVQRSIYTIVSTVVPGVNDPENYLGTEDLEYCNLAAKPLLSSAGDMDPIELWPLISERRKLIAEGVSGIDYDKLPLLVRSVAHDSGQTSEMKLDEDDGIGGCANGMGYPQINYTYDYGDDFGPNVYSCNPFNHRCWNNAPLYPNPRGTLSETWKAAVNSGTRKLAKINFDETGAGGNTMRVGLATNEPPFEELQEGWMDWTGTGRAYQPKAGDMFWRFDKCYHGTSTNRHAMTLIAAPYFDTTGQFKLPIWDGAFIYTIHDFSEFTGLLNTRLENIALTTICDSEPDPESGYVYCASVNDPNLWCPASVRAGFRFDYYIGETFNFEEIAIARNGRLAANGWQMIGSNLYTAPVDEDLRTMAHANLPSNPELDEMRFADFNGDGDDDLLWRTSSGDWMISFSPDYFGWTPVIDDNETVLECGPTDDCEGLSVAFFGDFGSYSENNDRDGLTDILRLRANTLNDNLIWEIKFNKGDQTPRFSPWLATSFFERFGNNTLKIHADNMVAGDFDGDGWSDIFFRDPSDATWKIWSIHDGQWITVKEYAPRDISNFQFADFDSDGLTDVITKLEQGNMWMRTELEENGYMGVWQYIGYTTLAETADIRDVRFGNFDGNATLDLFKVDGYGNWVVRYDTGSEVTIVGNSDIPVYDLRFLYTADGDKKQDILAFEALGRQIGHTAWDINYKTPSTFGLWFRAAYEDANFEDVAFGNFDGKDQLTDALLRKKDGTWLISFLSNGEYTSWQFAGRDELSQMDDLVFADFGDDDRTDVLRRLPDGTWQIRYLETDNTFGSWHWVLEDKASTMENLAFADFNADGKTDALRLNPDGTWEVNYFVPLGVYGMFGPWETIRTGETVPMSSLVFADFGDDAKTDVLRRQPNGTWEISYIQAGTQMFGAWQEVNRDTTTYLNDLAFVDFNADQKADVFRRRSDGSWDVAIFENNTNQAGAFGTWTFVGADSTSQMADLRFGHFDSDMVTDVIRRTTPNSTQGSACTVPGCSIANPIVLSGDSGTTFEIIDGSMNFLLDPSALTHTPTSTVIQVTAEDHIVLSGTITINGSTTNLNGSAYTQSFSTPFVPNQTIPFTITTLDPRNFKVEWWYN